MNDSFMLGAVAYCPEVVTIWDGFKRWFEEHSFPFDTILYTNYEMQVQAHLEGQIDVAWNSPLAWIQTERIARLRGLEASAIAMRDTDQDLSSVVIVRIDSAIDSVDDLKNKVVGVGAHDSPQATLIPLNHLACNGIIPYSDFTVLPFDRLVGKHGDHIGGERDEMVALIEGRCDAACLIESNYVAFCREGLISTASTRVVTKTNPFDHCCFTSINGRRDDMVEQFTTLLLGMSYEDEIIRPLFDLENLSAWLPGRTKGFAQLEEAVDRFNYLDDFVSRMKGGSA